MTEKIIETPVKKKKLSCVAVAGIGCLVILVVSLLAFGIAFTVAGKLITSTSGQGMLKNIIEQKTGFLFENGKNGDKFSITNKKTGESMELGEGTIPVNFPKDFPLYPGATPKGTAVGSDQSTGKGFWLLLESGDSISKVISYYDEQLTGKGWIVEEQYAIGDGSTYTVKKEKLVGNIIISTDKKAAKTTILITLQPTNEGNPEPQEVAPEGAEPVEESVQ